MIKKYGKPLEPKKFQQSVLDDMHGYVAQMKERAEMFASKTTVEVGACYVCGEHESNLHLEVYGVRYVACAACSHVRATRRMSAEALAEFYGDSQQYASTYTDLAQLDYRKHQIGGPKVDFVMGHIDMNEGRWLDVGCAVGDVVSRVSEYGGWNVLGLDASTLSTKVGAEYFDVDLRAQLFEDYLGENADVQFEVISFFGYLEVMTRPMQELVNAVERLVDGGYVVIGEAKADSVSTLVQKAHPELSKRHLLPPTVIHQYTTKSLLKTCELVGLEPVSIWFFGLDIYEHIGQRYLLDKGYRDSLLYEFEMEHLNELQMVIDRAEMSDNCVLVARKKN